MPCPRRWWPCATASWPARSSSSRASSRAPRCAIAVAFAKDKTEPKEKLVLLTPIVIGKDNLDKAETHRRDEVGGHHAPADLALRHLPPGARRQLRAALLDVDDGGRVTADLPLRGNVRQQRGSVSQCQTGSRPRPCRTPPARRRRRDQALFRRHGAQRRVARRAPRRDPRPARRERRRQVDAAENPVRRACRRPAAASSSTAPNSARPIRRTPSGSASSPSTRN